MRRTLASLVVVLSSMAMLSACVKSDTTEHQVVDSTSTTLELPDNPKIVALGWSDGEIALSLGLKPKAIYDWMAFGDQTKGVGSWASGEFGSDTPELISAQSAGAFNYQQIEEMQPDVILNVRSKLDDAVTANLKKIAPVVTAPKGTPDYAINWKQQTEIIGAALGKTSEAKALVDSTDAALAKAKQDNPSFEGKTFAYGAKFGDAYGASIAGDTRFDAFAALGFVQNPPILALQSSGFFAQVPVEKVSALDANVAVLTTIGKPFADLENDTLLRSLAVVRDGHAVMLDEKDPIVQALAAGTPKSLEFGLQGILPKLQTAAR